MPRRSIGIDIGRSHLHAVQVARTPEGFCLEKAFGAQTRRSTDSLPGILRSLTAEHGFDRRAEVAVSLPHYAFFFADIEIDEAGLERLRAADATGLKDHFPIPAEDIVAQVCSVLRFAGSKDSALVAATSSGQLRELLRLLGEGKIRPARVDTPITAAHAAVVTNHPESANGIALVLYADESTLSLAVTHDGKILLVRNIPMLPSPDENLELLAGQMAEVVGPEIEITWKRLFEAVPDASLRVFLVASHKMSGWLGSSLQQRLSGQVIAVDPFANVVRAADVQTDFCLCVAEGLALRTLRADEAGRINFLLPYHARTQPQRWMRKELTTCAGLAAAVAAVWVVGLFLQLSSLESNYARLTRQAIELFRQTVPEEKTIVDPAAQLRQKLDAARQDAELFTGFRPDGSSPLDVLQALSQRTPVRGSLKLQDVLITGDSVRIMGSCNSFTTFSEWQQSLATLPGFTVEDAPRTTKDAAESGRVQFTISLFSTKGRAS
jgi:Tfp pilus assembly PilM family ATPase/Tfp pilus assembly protein PilN